MRFVKRMGLFAIGMCIAAPAEAFDLDVTSSGALKLLGISQVGEMAIGDIGYIASGWGSLCESDGLLVIPDDLQLVSKNAHDRLVLRVLPGRKVSVQFPEDFEVDPADNFALWKLVIPTCNDLVAAGIIDSISGFEVSDINGMISYSEFIRTLKIKVPTE